MSRLTLLALALPLSTGLPGSPVLAQTATAQPPRPATPAPPTNAAHTERFTADTPRATPAGATFAVPAGWSMTARGPVVILDPPEPDSHLVLIDVSGAKDADAALAVAWAAYRPEAKRPLKLAVPQAARNGWDEQRRYEYETSPNERATVFAQAWRAGTQWVVTIVDASDATFEKRASPFSLAISSLRPKGYQRESFAGKQAHPLDEKRIAAMKDFVARGMKLLDVPGVGFSLLDGGNVVFEGGVGVKELGRPEAIDADTLFIAASNTKAMTTLLLAELVDENRLRWDQPVTEVYPSFKLGDAATTKQVLVKHLVCACTGLPRQDLEWLFEYRDARPALAMKLLGTMQPTSRFGEVFQYSNLMAAAAGYVGASLVFPGRELGAAYDEAMRIKIFEPLGMTHTTFDFATALKGNIAQPHSEDVDLKLVRARMDLNESVVPVRPAGGVWTSAHDLSRYVQMELARGALPGGKRLISEQNLLARRAPQILVSEDITYGMGLFVDKRWGVEIVHHGGDLAGYHSDMIWFPEHGVGAVILTNSDSGALLRVPFLRKLAVVLFDGKPEAEEQLRVAALQRKADLAKRRERLVVPADAKEVGKLAERYVSTGLGELNVRKDHSAVIFDVGEWKSTVASRKNDDLTISFITIDPTISGFEFVVTEKEGKRALVIRDAQHEYVFFEEAVKPSSEKRAG
jgi:CubicO group peptidase (beta-lactamase class C family)